MRRALPILVAIALLAPFGLPAEAGGSRPKPVRFAAKVFHGGGGEPNVSISPNGKTILIDGLGGSAQGDDQPAALWRSLNGGRTFQRLRPSFSDVGGGDWDMHWIDNRTIVAADLSIGSGIFVHRSTDRGSHWTTTEINEDVYDRPWLGVFHDHVYVVAKGFDGIPYCYVSNDGGRTFDPTPLPVYGTGTNPTPPEAFLTNQNAYVDRAMTDPRTGDLYVLFGIDSSETYGDENPVGVPDRLYVSHLEQGLAGPEFHVYPVYEGGAGDGFINGFNWLTIDRRGTLYVIGNGLHAGHQSTWLAYSTDHAQHWSKLVDVRKGPGANVYGAISAGRAGTLGMVYLHGTKADPNQQQKWYVEIERIRRANTANPRIRRWRPIAKPIHTHDICMSGILCGTPGFGNDRNLLDYIWDAISPKGKLFAIIASDGPATGGGDVDVVLLKQRSGRGFGAGVPS